jgi:toxin ParE1/3/4
MRDLEGIQYQGLTEFGADAALRYMQGFDGIFALLRQYPMAGPDRSDIGHNVRMFTYRSHRILYRYVNEEVTIARIVHHKIDSQRVLRN